jgi:hypothetical protein
MLVQRLLTTEREIELVRSWSNRGYMWLNRYLAMKGRSLQKSARVEPTNATAKLYVTALLVQVCIYCSIQSLPGVLCCGLSTSDPYHIPRSAEGRL